LLSFLECDSAAKSLLWHKGCINIPSERWRSMDAKPGEGEQAKGNRPFNTLHRANERIISGYKVNNTLARRLIGEYT